MAKIGDRIDDTIDSAVIGGGKVRTTLFGSLARSAASAAVSVTVTFATGWLLRKLFDKRSKSEGPLRK